ncbi:MAG: SdrD B-like domain-containing protein, partial [Anaerolineales bacterium]
LPPTKTRTPSPAPTPTAEEPGMTATNTAEPTATPTEAAVTLPEVMGPDEFPAGVNPLTGMLVEEPDLLDLPAVLISITNFPVSARPQAGLSFASHVYELFIGKGQTRFLVVFYGVYPHLAYTPANCPVEEMSFEGEGVLVGDFVWMDDNANGVQDENEAGFPQVCVHLMDPATHEILAKTGSDETGAYQFLVEPGREYYLQFIKPLHINYTTANLGTDDREDSDVDSQGVTREFLVTEEVLRWDVGLVGGSDPIVPIGPVRSGRVSYAQVQPRYPGSCMVFAGASEEVGKIVSSCVRPYGTDEDDINSAYFSVTNLRQLAEDGKESNEEYVYTGNQFSQTPPEDGQDAETVLMFYNLLNQTQWVYDEEAGGYLRSTDKADGTGIFSPGLDRLTAEQLVYQNVVVLFAEHTAYKPTVIDLDMAFTRGRALIFRNGIAYDVLWDTTNQAYEQETGRLRPVRFTGKDGNPFPLAPGQTWIHIVTDITQAWEESPGSWKIRFYAPPGS